MHVDVCNTTVVQSCLMNFLLSPSFSSLLCTSLLFLLPLSLSLSLSLSFFSSPSLFLLPLFLLLSFSLFPVLCLLSSLNSLPPSSFFLSSSFFLPLSCVMSPFFPQFSLPHSSPDTSVPNELITLRKHGVRCIACGDDHTAILTAVNTQMVLVSVCSYSLV